LVVGSWKFEIFSLLMLKLTIIFLDESILAEDVPKNVSN
jgi:hypothetical protein